MKKSVLRILLILILLAIALLFTACSSWSLERDDYAAGVTAEIRDVGVPQADSPETPDGDAPEQDGPETPDGETQQPAGPETPEGETQQPAGLETPDGETQQPAESETPQPGEPELPDEEIPQTAESKAADGPPDSVANGQAIGRIIVPAVNLTDALTVGTSLDEAQEVLEGNAALMHYDYMGLPAQASVSVIGGHNYMKFDRLKDAQVGDSIILELDWGIYEYVIYEIKIQPELRSAPRGNLVVYTCYPFDNWEDPDQNAYFMCRPKDS
jgi:sortase A